ncbi:MAG TPA: ribosome maturation factor RimP [Candidatus Caenarcaniphilales bacterium]
MAHPLIPQIIALANPIAESLGLEVVGATFHTHQNPPVLRVNIRNRQADTSLDDCERMSRSLEATLDTTNLIPDLYVLEISSPGLSRFLSTDREFDSFRGFTITVHTCEADESQKQRSGQLLGRDETSLYLNQKGRKVKIPRDSITQVQLNEQ